MNSQLLPAKNALLALSALVVTACNGNSIEGTVAGHEFGAIKTAFFDLDDVGTGSPVPLLLMVDIEWSCEDVNLLFASLEAANPDEALFTDHVIGGLFLELGKIGEDGESIMGSTDLTDYTVVPVMGETPAAGSYVAVGLAMVGKVDADTSDELMALTQSGTLTVNTFDEQKLMGGEFNITLLDEEEQTGTITGTFNLSHCEFELDSYSEARLQLASLSHRFPGSRR